ncbi:MAG: AMP-binding protein, partial [Clostridiales bacterium]|nr:AMP-binding protein [Clostridiales bacterium]
MNATIDIAARSQQLRENKTLQGIFDITCSDPALIAAHYLEGDEEKSITFGEYRTRAMDAAAFLQRALGSENRGRFVAIQMETSIHWFTVFWGLAAAGYQALLLDASLNDEMTRHMLAQAGACGVIGKAKRDLPSDIRQVLLDDILASVSAPQGFTPAFGTQVALCSSGTTATSRIFVYDEDAICNQVLNSELLHHMNPRIISGHNERSLAFLPYHHVFGFMVNLLWSNFIGYESVFIKDRAPETILNTSRRFRVSFLCAVPLLANNLSVGLNKKVALQGPRKRAAFKFARGLSLFLQSVAPNFGMDFARNVLFKDVVAQLIGPDIRCVILGGSHTPAEHMRTIAALGYYTVSGFGMTETAITSVETGMNLHTRTSGSVGRPLTSVEYRVQSDGKRANTGEMFIRGQSIHTGRLEDGRLIGPLLDKDGWYMTGDIVRLEKGMRMYVEGRSKDVIINESGENVYPDEIEDTFGALEGVDQFCVLGTKNVGGSRPNRWRWRRQHHADYEDITLVLSVGDRYRDDKFLTDLMRQIASLNARLPVIKKITRVLATPDKFQTANGIKVKRLALKQMIEEKKIAYRDLDLKSGAGPVLENVPIVNEEAAPRDLAPDEIRNKVRRVYAETLAVAPETIDDDAHFITDLGGDSLQVLSVSLKVEELFGVLIPVEEYGLCTTVNDLSHLLEGRLNNEAPITAREPQAISGPVTRFEDSEEYKAFAAREEALLSHGMENPYFVAHDSPLTDTSVMDGQR